MLDNLIGAYAMGSVILFVLSFYVFTLDDRAPAPFNRKWVRVIMFLTAFICLGVSIHFHMAVRPVENTESWQEFKDRFTVSFPREE